jgi:Polyketide cyclase / dehydrase and lipid transport
MKKVFKILALLLIGFIAFGLYNASGLQSITLETKTTIKSDKQTVFNLVKNLQDFPKWSPFLVQDPTQKYEVKGTNGTVGSQYHWVGNGGDDVGYQEITKIDEGTFIAKKCDIQKPFVAKPTFDYTFSETANGVVVKETFKLQSGLADAFFLWLFGAKAEMVKTNQQGLDLLKKAAVSAK